MKNRKHWWIIETKRVGEEHWQVRQYGSGQPITHLSRKSAMEYARDIEAWPDVLTARPRKIGFIDGDKP